MNKLQRIFWGPSTFHRWHSAYFYPVYSAWVNSVTTDNIGQILLVCLEILSYPHWMWGESCNQRSTLKFLDEVGGLPVIWWILERWLYLDKWL